MCKNVLEAYSSTKMFKKSNEFFVIITLEKVFPEL